jgi:hypothetical protein
MATHTHPFEVTFVTPQDSLLFLWGSLPANTQVRITLSGFNALQAATELSKKGVTATVEGKFKNTLVIDNPKAALLLPTPQKANKCRGVLTVIFAEKYAGSSARILCKQVSPNPNRIIGSFEMRIFGNNTEMRLPAAVLRRDTAIAFSRAKAQALTFGVKDELWQQVWPTYIEDLVKRAAWLKLDVSQIKPSFYGEGLPPGLLNATEQSAGTSKIPVWAWVLLALVLLILLISFLL